MIVSELVQATEEKLKQKLKPGEMLKNSSGKKPKNGLMQQRFVRDMIRAVVYLGLYTTLGIFVYTELEPTWTYIDAFYFCMATMSTVGYGDIYPSNDVSRWFSIFMIFTGIIFVFAAVGEAIGHLTRPITAAGRQLMELLFPQIPVDLDGDGGVDYYKPRPPVIYYTKNLLPSLILTFSVQVGSAAVFVRVTGDGEHPPWTFGLALYHCLVTATTVGYGDARNSTQLGRLWAGCHIIIAVALVGELLSTIRYLARQRASTMARVAYLEREFDQALLDQLIARAIAMRPLVKRDGKGLTELEYVIAMTIELGIVEWNQVQPFIKQFRMLDITGDARLGAEDLKLMLGKTRKEIAAITNALNANAKPMSVGDRMGLSFQRPGAGTDDEDDQASGGAAAPVTYTDEADIPLDGLSVEMLEALISRAQGMVDKQQDVQHVKQACRAQRTGAPAEAPATANGHKGLRVAVFV